MIVTYQCYTSHCHGLTTGVIPTAYSVLLYEDYPPS